LIIFDLDDTLLNTSELVTPYVLKQVLHRWIEEGLFVDSFEKTYREFLSINLCSSSSYLACKTFLEKKGKMSLLPAAEEELKKDYIDAIEITPKKKILQLLKKMQTTNDLNLVTIGQRNIQLKKLKKAGIDKGFFSKIVISEDNDKFRHYKDLLKESLGPVLVCGDRIDKDLLPAKRLGFYTVLIRKGRGKLQTENHEAVDFSINQLEEILPIIDTLEGKKE
jgi:FMN phosphatase YigB (HAD superfamily)